MNDLISRLSELRCQYNCFDENKRDAYHTLSEAIKAISAQRTGRWIEHRDYPGLAYLCSECNLFTTDKSYYCPKCGAKMEVEEWMT